uniref:hypothetical protein n=1 Tax=Pleurosigma intermedium TaxID=197753 RepID=UPI00218204B7|nr:hypothetical protein N4L43_pgp085 [Pleurosigma intermedium]UVG42035.1 hypothetical protein [Pleurosigma intermedium]
MNQILYEKRCQCNEKFSIFQKRSSTNPSEGNPLPYTKKPLYEIEEIEGIPPKIFTFQIKYEKKLSTVAKFILNSFQKKYIYYAIDDILYLLKSKPIERDNLLSIIYSPIVSLQNNFSINFFDIWIHEIYINEVSKVNKFIANNSQNFEQFNYITIKLFYKTGLPRKKQETLW